MHASQVSPTRRTLFAAIARLYLLVVVVHLLFLTCIPLVFFLPGWASERSCPLVERVCPGPSVTRRLPRSPGHHGVA